MFGNRNLSEFDADTLQRAHAKLWKHGVIGSKWEYRHYHIAYCEVRGRTREQIEKSEDVLNEKWIADIKAEIIAAMEVERAKREAFVRDCA